MTLEGVAGVVIFLFWGLQMNQQVPEQVAKHVPEQVAEQVPEQVLEHFSGRIGSGGSSGTDGCKLPSKFPSATCLHDVLCHVDIHVVMLTGSASRYSGPGPG